MLFKGQILSTFEPTTVISTVLDGNTANLRNSWNTAGSVLLT